MSYHEFLYILSQSIDYITESKTGNVLILPLSYSLGLIYASASRKKERRKANKIFIDC